jgi:DNA polymerase III subunit alpha
LLVVPGKASLDKYSSNVWVSGEELFDFASARFHFAQQLDLYCNGNASHCETKKAIYTISRWQMSGADSLPQR